ncbi:MAG TPA: hypothetical protein VF017_03250 [Thermoanaerobaculia bacterium]|nr:hypothetical protein [Thermoanaerobaculia bacterium]
MTRLLRSLAVAAALAALALPLHAGTVDKTVNFALDQWIELNATDGPVTLHRLMIAKQGGITKSKLLRPSNSEYLTDVQIVLEFSNDASKDWEAALEIEWVDANGQAIDGYNDTESLDSESHQDDTTVTLSTLKYGLERAKKLKVKIDFYRD